MKGAAIEKVEDTRDWSAAKLRRLLDIYSHGDISPEWIKMSPRDYLRFYQEVPKPYRYIDPRLDYAHLAIQRRGTGLCVISPDEGIEDNTVAIHIPEGLEAARKEER